MIIFFLLSIVIFSTHAMEDRAHEEQSVCAKPNIPRYDRALRCFTRAPLSLKACALKQIPRVLVPNLEDVRGSTLDAHTARIQEILESVPTELHKEITNHLMFYAAKNGYPMIFYKKYKTKASHSHYVIRDNKFLIDNQTDQITFECDDTIIDADFNDQGTAAISLSNGSVHFFQKNNEVWQTRGTTLPNSSATQCHLTHFLDNNTCVSYNKNTPKALTIHTLQDTGIESSIMPLESPIHNINPNKPFVIFFIDAPSQEKKVNLFCCLKKGSEICIQKVTQLSSDEEFTSIISEEKFFNYVLSDVSKSPRLNVVGLLDNDMQFIKKIQTKSIFTMGHPVYVRSIKKGMLHLAQCIEEHKDINREIFVHHALDITSEIRIATFHTRFTVKPRFNLPYQAILAAIALKNSNNPSELDAGEKSSAVENLSQELREQLKEEYNKKEAVS